MYPLGAGYETIFLRTRPHGVVHPAEAILCEQQQDHEARAIPATPRTDQIRETSTVRPFGVSVRSAGDAHGSHGGLRPLHCGGAGALRQLLSVRRQYG